MATTTTILGVNLKHAPHMAVESSPLWVFEIVARINGTYRTATTPTLDVLAALQAQREGISAVSVLAAGVLQDGINKATSGTSAGLEITAPQADMALSSTGNKLMTFDLDYSPATPGASGTELGDTDPVDVVLSFWVVTGITKA